VLRPPPDIRAAEVTFVLTSKILVTVRYVDPLPFRTFAAKCRRDPGAHDTSELVSCRRSGKF
jgi:magnesium transporter